MGRSSQNMLPYGQVSSGPWGASVCECDLALASTGSCNLLGIYHVGRLVPRHRAGLPLISACTCLCNGSNLPKAAWCPILTRKHYSQSVLVERRLLQFCGTAVSPWRLLPEGSQQVLDQQGLLPILGCHKRQEQTICPGLHHSFNGLPFGSKGKLECPTFLQSTPCCPMVHIWTWLAEGQARPSQGSHAQQLCKSMLGDRQEPNVPHWTCRSAGESRVPDLSHPAACPLAGILSAMHVGRLSQPAVLADERVAACNSGRAKRCKTLRPPLAHALPAGGWCPSSPQS